MRKSVAGFTPEAEALLQTHPFPGNVRELRNAIERAAILCRAGRVEPDDLVLELTPVSDDVSQEMQSRPSDLTSDDTNDLPAAFNLAQAESLDLNALVSAVEKEAIREALRRSSNNQFQAAKLLGISRYTLRRRMTHYGL